MAEQQDKTAKAALGISASAAVIAALAFITKRAEAKPGGQQAELPKELWDLIISVANSTDNIEQGIKEAIEVLNRLSINVQGFPPNTETVIVVRVACNVVGTAVQLPDLPVPDGFPLHLLAYPFNPPGSFLQVGPSAAGCININQSYPMPPTTTKDYFVKNANVLWVSSNAVPAWLVATAEQRRS